MARIVSGGTVRGGRRVRALGALDHERADGSRARPLAGRAEERRRGHARTATRAARARIARLIAPSPGARRARIRRRDVVRGGVGEHAPRAVDGAQEQVGAVRRSRRCPRPSGGRSPRNTTPATAVTGRFSSSSRNTREHAARLGLHPLEPARGGPERERVELAPGARGAPRRSLRTRPGTRRRPSASGSTNAAQVQVLHRQRGRPPSRARPGSREGLARHGARTHPRDLELEVDRGPRRCPRWVRSGVGAAVAAVPVPHARADERRRARARQARWRPSFDGAYGGSRS